MATNTGAIRFKARLSRPAKPEGAAWTFLVLPAAASAKLPTRSMTTVEGSLNGAPFQATVEPDGKGSHWLKVDKALREAADVVAGDSVALEIAPVEKEPEPKVPADLKQALAGNAAAKATWARRVFERSRHARDAACELHAAEAPRSNAQVNSLVSGSRNPAPILLY